MVTPLYAIVYYLDLKPCPAVSTSKSLIWKSWLLHDTLNIRLRIPFQQLMRLT